MGSNQAADLSMYLKLFSSNPRYNREGESPFLGHKTISMVFEAGIRIFHDILRLAEI